MTEYTRIIGLKYPDVKCHATGPNYSDITWISSTTTTIPIPQATLDADVISLTSGSLNQLVVPSGVGMMCPFISNSSNISSAYMSVYGDISSSTNGIVVPHASTILNAIISVGSAVGSNATFYIRKNRAFSTNIATLVLPAGNTKALVPVNVELNALDELCIYVGSTNVNRPVVTLEIDWS